MSFISGFTERFRGKKAEVPVTPKLSTDELKIDVANLETQMAQGRDYKNPADANRLRELRNQLAEAERSQAPLPTASPEVKPILQPTQEVPGIINIKDHQPVATTPASEKANVA